MSAVLPPPKWGNLRRRGEPNEHSYSCHREDYSPSRKREKERLRIAIEREIEMVVSAWRKGGVQRVERGKQQFLYACVCVCMYVERRRRNGDKVSEAGV